MLEEATLTLREQKTLQLSFRNSKKKTKSNTKVSARDECQTPPYALLPLLSYIPKDWTVWESAASKYGFLGEAIRVLHGNYVIETGLELDGTNYLTTNPKGDVQITNPPYSNPLKFEWIERAYENRQPFALLMPFETWAAARAQAQFQRHGMSIIILNRRINFHMPYKGWDGKGSDYPVAWFTWGLPFMKEAVTYGYVPLEKDLPGWMVRPDHKREITEGAKRIEDRLAIRHASNPITWPAPTKGGQTAKKEK